MATKGLRGWFVVLMIALSAVGCNSQKDIRKPVSQREIKKGPQEGTTRSGDSSSTLHELQRKSLTYVFYRDNPMPPSPAARELDELDQKFSKASPSEVELLQNLYGEERDLLVYATRDSDGDGLLDYRIDETSGKFMEGDPDLVSDGLLNVYHENPYQAVPAGVHDEFGIPDKIPRHLDWSIQGKPRGLVECQKRFFNRYRMILLERNSEFTPELCSTLEDVVGRVFQRAFSAHPLGAILNTVSTERDESIDPTNPADTYALTISQTRSMIFFNKMAEANPVFQLGVLVHEMAHVYEYWLDSDETQRKEQERNVYRHTNYVRVATEFGWEFRPCGISLDDVFYLWRPQYQEIYPWTMTFRGRSPEDWEKRVNELGDDYLDASEFKKNDVVGDYSLTSPWEWHGDNMIAYVYNGMEDSAEKICGDGEAEAVTNRFRKDDKEFWSMDHSRARGNPAMKHFFETFPVSAEDWQILTRRYLLAVYPCASGTDKRL